MGMRRSRDIVASLLLVALAAGFMGLWIWAPIGPSAYDIYMYYQPNMLYALQRLSVGGSGLLWNAWQNCGQPSFGISSTGFLYPANLLYLLLSPDLALRLVIGLNFAVAGLGAYALCRQLSLSRAAALCGAFAFELGGATIHLNTWGPQMGGPWVWLPASLYCCERLLQSPRPRLALALAVTLALPLLPGFPQTVFFAYQLIALRVVYELATRPAARTWPTLGWIGAGLVLAPLLVAIHLVPGLEMAARSIRGGALSLEELQPGVAPTVGRVLTQISGRLDTFNPIVIVPAMVAAAWWCRRATRRVGAFYFLAGVLYFLLSLGSSTPVFDLYRRLPLGSLFREPARFMWITNFCVAVLCGLGADALLRHVAGRWRRFAAPAALAAGVVALALIVNRGLLPAEWLLATALLASGVAVAVSARARPAARVVTVLAVALGVGLFRSLVPAPATPATAKEAMFGARKGWGLALRNMPLKRLIDGGVYDEHADQLRALAARMTPQERSYFDFTFADYSLMPKSASLFDVASPQDYEPQPPRRYAEYFIMMRNGVPLRTLNQYYFPTFGPQDFRRPLLDLSAARFVVAAPAAGDIARFGEPPLVPLADAPAGDLLIYENPAALPRAFYVPQAAVVPDAAALLQRLAAGGDDRRSLLLLEEPPASGFLGAPLAADAEAATVEFLINEPEHVVLRVHAPAAGFVHLADQHFPGWRATVNDREVPILRANHLFRAIEVPAGDATIDLRYRPGSFRLGAGISGVTVLLLLGGGLWRWTRAGDES